MRHPDDQPTGDAGSFRSDGAVTSHDVARMSDAELLTLYLGLFAHTDAGRHPGIYDVHGPSLQELAEGDDELSRVGNELAGRYEERGGRSLLPSARAICMVVGAVCLGGMTLSWRRQQRVAQSNRGGPRFGHLVGAA